MQRILDTQFAVQAKHEIIDIYDTILSLPKLIQILFCLVKPKDYNLYQRVESTSQNHIMFNCGTVFNFNTKSVLLNDESSFFSAKLDFTYEQYLNTSSSYSNEVHKILLTMFHNEDDFHFFLNYVITSISGLNSF